MSGIGSDGNTFGWRRATMPLVALFYETLVQGGKVDEPAAFAILEIAFLTMWCDRHLDDEEFALFARLTESLLPGHAAPRELLTEFSERQKSADPEPRLEELAGQLSPVLRQAAYQVACVMALADHEESDREFEFDLTLISALDLDQADADRLAAEARAAAGIVSTR